MRLVLAGTQTGVTLKNIVLPAQTRPHALSPHVLQEVKVNHMQRVYTRAGQPVHAHIMLGAIYRVLARPPHVRRSGLASSSLPDLFNAHDTL